MNRSSRKEFNWFTYFCGEVTLYRSKVEFKAVIKNHSLITKIKDLQPISDLANIPQLQINKFWYYVQMQCIHYKLGSRLSDIYTELTGLKQASPMFKIWFLNDQDAMAFMVDFSHFADCEITRHLQGVDLIYGSVEIFSIDFPI